jgi:CRISPR-associated protein Cas2
MSHTEQRNWLIAYDIADPRRLGKVHRYLKGYAVPVQYSVFVFQGSQIALECVLSGIAARIEPDADDVRAYHLPSRCEVAMLGRQNLPEGVVLGAHGLDRLCPLAR